MPSLRKRVSSYLRQLSFHNEPRDKRNNVNENAFVTKYLQGLINLKEGPPIIYGKNPTDLPSYDLGRYDSGSNSIVGCYTGPNGGLTTVKRTEKHLCIPDDDIDFIDTHEDEPVQVSAPKKNFKRAIGGPIDNTTMVIKVAGHEYRVTNKPKRHSRSHSLGSMSEFGVEVERTRKDSRYCDINDVIEDVITNIDLSLSSSKQNEDHNKDTNKEDDIQEKNNVVSNRRKTNTSNDSARDKRSVSHHTVRRVDTKQPIMSANVQAKNYPLSKSKSEGDPFRNKRRGKIIQIERPKRDESQTGLDPFHKNEDAVLPGEWNKRSDFCYGISDSLYDRNQITRQKNGDPIADCFGIIARKDSAILAVADGVNWGEKAAVAAKSAVHGSLHYLNKTIFNDTKPFEKLTGKTDEANLPGSLNPDESLNLVGNTREVFVALLRAFNCAHDLILENKGMLTTLTVAVVLPLKSKSIRIDNGVRTNHEPQFVCCVCNVGDTLAYVFSQKYGIRELTKGSHDVNSNRDMRDALGALGPVDGINPELSNLTLSITTLNKDDILMVASDGLTDNFDPNVCKFTVNSAMDPPKAKRQGIVASQQQNQIKNESPPEKLAPHREEVVNTVPKPPVKPPRKSKNRGSITSVSQSESRSNSSIESDAKNSSVPQPSSPSLHESSSNIPPSRTESSNQSDAKTEYQNPLVDHFMRQNSLDESKSTCNTKAGKPQTLDSRKQPPVMENKASSLRRQISSQKNPPTSRTQPREGGYKLLKSKTSLDFRASSHKPQILRNKDGVPYVTPLQRYELQLLLMEDVLLNGISGQDSPTANAKRLCENLISFTISITAAKRRTLEDPDMYFDNRNGVLMEVSSQEKKLRRKRGLEKVQILPGKLDHVTVVAYNVGV